ncbi:PREDICTED: protein C19orf12-like [Eufriesea mexicana]|uniref:protein C19orf12-like n=1 Tax=Eufriesea mexicana TaxID=516756 RepID=UPI00083C4B0C|nr:PREDICTED: protein C19orf12-like [Eufriesea mexicana]
MSLSLDKVLELVLKTESVQDLKVSIYSSMKYGTLVGASTVIGGLLAGPIGLTMGGVVSSIIMGCYAKDKFESLSYVIYHRMTPEERQKISKQLLEFITMKNILTLNNLALFLVGDASFVQQIIQLLIAYLASEFNITVIQKQ